MTLRAKAQTILPGLSIATVVALAAKFLSEHYGVPALLMALLMGMAFQFLSEEGNCVAGIEFCSNTLLRIGVALLGAQITIELVADLGITTVAFLIVVCAVTVVGGIVGAWMLGRGWRLGVLTGGAVAICGASAALAIAAILPKNEHSERNLVFAIVGVTVLSTIAMIIYPIIGQALGLNDKQMGLFIGATIHDVAQAVGAGFSVSQDAGETATLVKLIRVSLLAPLVLLLSLVMRTWVAETASHGKKPPLVPWFVAIFGALAAINSLGVIPPPVAEATNHIARWALLIAIAAVGMKASLQRISTIGVTAIVLIIAETALLGLLVIVGMRFLN